MTYEILKSMRADLIPAGESGNWAVTKYDVLATMGCKHGDRDVIIDRGQYTALTCHTDATMHLRAGELVMHDVLYELKKHLHFIIKATGRVLVTGLGLGCVVRGLLSMPKVEHVTVIEKSLDVIKLVAPFMPSTNRLDIIEADATEWVKKPDRKFECAWHDLWTDVTKCEPHLQLVHSGLIAELAGDVKMQGAWEFPRQFRRTWKDFGVI